MYMSGGSALGPQGLGGTAGRLANHPTVSLHQIGACTAQSALTRHAHFGTGPDDVVRGVLDCTPDRMESAWIARVYVHV